jgi:hypothetical protein
MTTITRTPPLLAVYLRAANDLHVPALVVEPDARTHAPPATLLIDREIQMHPGVSTADWLNWYKKELTGLPPGVYQMTVHLGFDDDELRGATADHPDWGAAWRQADYNLVSSPEFQQFLRDQHFILVGWRDLAKAMPK